MPPKKMPPVRLASPATSHDDILHPSVAREQPPSLPTQRDDSANTIRTESIVRTIRIENKSVEEKPLRIPFTNNLPPAMFRAWFTYAYMARLPLQEVLERALTAYLQDKALAREPLPPEQEAILAAKEEAELSRRQKRRTK
jgi:hypothetical protein